VKSKDIFAIRHLVNFKGGVGLELNNGDTGTIFLVDAIGDTASFEGVGNPPRLPDW
jgi:hypothetical protein